MGMRHTVKQGESVESIAHATGHHWPTVWNHPENATLRQQRKSPHVLHPGDVLFLPTLIPAEKVVKTGQHHRFRVRRGASRLTVRFVRNDTPRAHVPYVLVVDGEERTGTTDGDGWLREPVHPQALQAEVRFAREGGEGLPDYVPAPADDDATHEGPSAPERAAPEGASHDIYRFSLRQMDPSSEVSGAQARLLLMGYSIGESSGELNEETREGLRAFQRDQGLEVTAELDEATQARLAEFIPG